MLKNHPPISLSFSDLDKNGSCIYMKFIDPCKSFEGSLFQQIWKGTPSSLPLQVFTLSCWLFFSSHRAHCISWFEIHTELTRKIGRCFKGVERTEYQCIQKQIIYLLKFWVNWSRAACYYLGGYCNTLETARRWTVHTCASLILSSEL